MPNLIEPLSWLIGTWRCENDGKMDYPTKKPFDYCEEISVTNVGQPMLNYKSMSWHPQLKFPMHQETGFLRFKPDTLQVSLLLSHNFGLTSIEEGYLEDKCLTLKSTSISRIGYAKEPHVTELQRTFMLVDENSLLQTVLMATTKTSLAKHLEA